MKILSFLALTLLLLRGQAQSNTEYYSTPENLANKMLEMISGPQGEERDWETYRQLFLPSAQKISINSKAPIGKRIHVLNLEEFIRRIGPLYARDGFEEKAIGLEVHEFNGVALVFQPFYCRNLIGTYEKRGVNTYQMVYDQDRWWIASVAYSNETEDNPLPEEILFK